VAETDVYNIKHIYLVMALVVLFFLGYMIEYIILHNVDEFLKGLLYMSVGAFFAMLKQTPTPAQNVKVEGNNTNVISKPEDEELSPPKEIKGVKR
jgi:hypothetical protein